MHGQQVVVLAAMLAIFAGAQEAAGPEKIYWVDFGTAKVQRSNLDGTNVEDLITTDLNLPYGIAVDLAGGKTYFTELAGSANGGRVMRANLDGSEVQVLVQGTSALFGVLPRHIALDVVGGKMYWMDPLGSAIRRANLDGSSIETVAAGAFATGVGVALDLINGHRYWTRTTEIRRDGINVVNPDPTQVQGESFVTGLDQAVGIDLPISPDLPNLPDLIIPEASAVLVSSSGKKPGRGAASHHRDHRFRAGR